MEFVEVTRHNVEQAAEVHAISWRESHRAFCSEEFVAAHTTEHQTAYLQKEMDEGKKVFMLVDKKPVGVVSVIGNLIENLYVLPAEHRKGYGSKLLKFAIFRCEGEPSLWILSNNKRAHSLYLKNGFRETGNRKYHTEDLFEMEMKIEMSGGVKIFMEFIEKIPILNGWSDDRKYCAIDKNGMKYLLRVSGIDRYDTKKSEFLKMKKAASLGIAMCLPIAFGMRDDGVYSIQSWIDGEDAKEMICKYSDKEQYSFGIEAGHILQKIHSIPAPTTQEDWEIYFNRKMDHKIQRYHECSIKYENGQAFIDYINENRHLLKNRPQVYQHGDYHVGNMMIGNDGKLYVIDFDRNDYGDPWEEFNRIVWSAQESPFFASGMVNGYFDDCVPVLFWRLLALYISSNALSSICWAVAFGQEQVGVMVSQAEEILNWYDNMKSFVPTWYIRVDKGR